jgi:hypothetical protein
LFSFFILIFSHYSSRNKIGRLLCYFNCTKLTVLFDYSVSFDGQEMMRVEPGPGGFWTYGKLDTELPPESNPWQYSSNIMAPFDEEVNIGLYSFKPK